MAEFGSAERSRSNALLALALFLLAVLLVAVSSPAGEGVRSAATDIEIAQRAAGPLVERARGLGETRNRAIF